VPEKIETPQKSSTKEKQKRRPSLSLNSIAKAVSEVVKTPNQETTKDIKRHGDQHDALEDATITLKLTEALTNSTWMVNLPQEKDLKEMKKIKEGKTRNISMEN
jgi:hypothetical protein